MMGNERDFELVEPPMTYPEKTDRRIVILENEVNRLRDELDYLAKLVHKYINEDGHASKDVR